MPLHSRRPPTPPAPEFYIAGPQPPETAELETAPSEQAALGSRPSALGEAGSRREPRAEGRELVAAWHQSEPWAVVMLVSFAIMLVAIYVPGTVKLVLIGVSAVTALAGIVMLVRQGVFDEPRGD